MLQNTSSETFSVSSMCRGLKSVGLKSAVKKKCPILSKHHRKERLEFAQAHEHWTLEDWKKVVWSDETKINHLGSVGGSGCGKRPENLSVIAWLKGPSSLEEEV
jgi:Transposase